MSCIGDIRRVANRRTLSIFGMGGFSICDFQFTNASFKWQTLYVGSQDSHRTLLIACGRVKRPNPGASYKVNGDFALQSRDLMGVSTR